MLNHLFLHMYTRGVPYAMILYLFMPFRVMWSVWYKFPVWAAPERNQEATEASGTLIVNPHNLILMPVAHPLSQDVGYFPLEIPPRTISLQTQGIPPRLLKQKSEMSRNPYS